MSGATSRRKGNRAEVEVTHALIRAGWSAVTSRAARAGTQRGADILTSFPAVVEVKDRATLDLSGWCDQAERQADGEPWIVVHKRRGRAHAEDWYVTLDLKTLFRLVSPREVKRWQDTT